MFVIKNTTFVSKERHHPITIERVDGAGGDGPGARILVDRLWPRGVRKDELLSGARQQELLDELSRMARAGPLTLLYSARDEEHNQAVVVRELLEERLRGGGHGGSDA